MEYQLRKTGEQVWTDGNYRNLKEEIMAEGYEYRLKPAASKWPQTTMTISELGGIYTRTPTDRTLKEFANIILAHACETGALVPADKVREISAGAYAQGAKSARDPVDIIEAVFDHLRAGIADPESIQAILLRAAK